MRLAHAADEGVDHGKTALIRQLAGVDTDRLAEEKRRGLSINLGYAYLPRKGAKALGFIDVPGHRRFINTMIAGPDVGLAVPIQTVKRFLKQSLGSEGAVNHF